jgi:C-terminal processing protease CtpA/Prc
MVTFLGEYCSLFEAAEYFTCFVFMHLLAAQNNRVFSALILSLSDNREPLRDSQTKQRHRHTNCPNMENHHTISVFFLQFQSAIIIHEVYPDGAAAKDGRLRPGDQILEVNTEDFRSITHTKALAVLRQTPAKVRKNIFAQKLQ